MDMHMDMGGASGNMTMVPFMHLGMGDMLWFLDWMPMSPGAVVGASIGLFLLAIVERLVSAMRAVAEAYWKRKAESIVAARLLANMRSKCSAASCDEGSKCEPSLEDAEPELEQVPTVTTAMHLASLRAHAPFILPHELARGVFQLAQAALLYALMLAIMTFNGGYFIAIVFGSGVGEFLFGRYGRSAMQH